MASRGRSRTGPSRASRPERCELADGAIGSARVTAFGASNVASAGAVVGGLVIVVGYAGFLAPLVVLIALVASLWAVAVIAALVITILIKIGPGHYPAAVLSPASSPPIGGHRADGTVTRTGVMCHSHRLATMSAWISR
jgi:hypothetical protein